VGGVPVTREERTQRLLRDRAALLAEGRRVGGNAPYGYRHGVRGALVPIPAEQHVRWLVRHLASRGDSLQKIADQLTALGIPSRSGNRWSRATLHRIVRAPDEEQEAATG
jgi:hypothetical protein